MIESSAEHLAVPHEPVLVDGYVPLIDLSHALTGDAAARRAVAGALDHACRTSGFFLIAGHGVDSELVDRMLDVTRRFFHVPLDQRRDLVAPPGDITLRGLRLFHEGRAGSDRGGASQDAGATRMTAPPDLCELFTMNRLGEATVADGAGLADGHEVWSRPNRWPSNAGLADFKPTWMAFYAELERIADELMRLFALGLDLPERFFDSMIDEHLANLCANYYPPVTTAPADGQYRKFPHTDSGTVTLLYQDDEGGLQVIDRTTGEWVDVPFVPGSFCVNIGDLMAIWTNDRWVSTQHRILVPPPERRDRERISLPFFHQPNWSTVVECLPSCTDESNPPRHAPVKSGEYLAYKVAGLAA